MNVYNLTRKPISFFLLFICATCFLSTVSKSSSARETEIPPCNGDEEAGTLCSLPLTDVHPTQFSVGMILVLCKKSKIEEKSLKKLKKYLRRKKNRVPAIISPDKKFYMTDGHHFCSALFLAKNEQWQGKKQSIIIQVIRNDSQDNLTVDAFWKRMIETGSVFPFDENGKRVENFGSKLALMTIAQLEDDPYRTLSTWVREGCGYIKKSENACVALNGSQEPGGSQPYIEQYWAMYLQNLLGSKDIVSIEQLWQLYPRAIDAVLDKKKTAVFFSALGLNPQEYGQNLMGNHLKLRLHQTGCAQRETTAQ